MKVRFRGTLSLERGLVPEVEGTQDGMTYTNCAIKL